MQRIGSNVVLFEEMGKLIVKVSDPVQKQTFSSMKDFNFIMTNAGDGCLYVEMPWDDLSAHILYSMGYDCLDLAPFMFADHPLVEGRYAPMKHQLYTAAFITLNPRCYVLSDPRTGKTGALTLAMDYIQRRRLIAGGWLIITTVTTMPGVWRDSIKAALPDATVYILNGRRREEYLAKPADFYITNYDSVRLSEQAFKAAVSEGRIGGCVIDELTHVGNTSSQRHKAIDHVVNGMGLTYVIGATGSPGENPETVFGMCRVINRNALPAKTKTGWINMTTLQYGPERFMRVPVANAPEIIHKAMQPAIRYNKADIIDLPPVTTQDRDCALSAEQNRMRKELKQEAMAFLQSGEVVTAANGGVLYSKLIQVAQGFVMDSTGKPIALDHKDRTNVILDTIRETDRKVVVFCCYKAAIRQRCDEIRAAGYSCDIVDGSITGNKRAEILKAFLEDKDPHVLVAHPTTTAYGVELASADTLVFDGPPLLGGFIFAQAIERLSSAKQTAPRINIVRVMSSPEERKAFKGLDAGHSLGVMISSLFEDLVKGLL